MDRAAKEQVVSEFKEIFNSSEIIIAVHYAGLDAVAINSLRKENELLKEEIINLNHNLNINNENADRNINLMILIVFILH